MTRAAFENNLLILATNTSHGPDYAPSNIFSAGDKGNLTNPKEALSNRDFSWSGTKTNQDFRCA